MIKDHRNIGAPYSVTAKAARVVFVLLLDTQTLCILFLLFLIIFGDFRSFMFVLLRVPWVYEQNQYIHIRLITQWQCKCLVEEFEFVLPIRCWHIYSINTEILLILRRFKRCSCHDSDKCNILRIEFIKFVILWPFQSIWTKTYENRL